MEIIYMSLNTLNKHGNELIFKSNMSQRDRENIFSQNTPLKDMLNGWCQINGQYELNINKIGQTIIWNNTV